jgi:hypothetical protein
MNKSVNRKRRDFLKITAVGAAGIAMSGGLAKTVMGKDCAQMAAGPGNQWPGRVVINFNKNAVTRSGINATPIDSVIEKMVDDAILLLTGAASVGAAWKSIFPATLTAQSKIAIKINILNNGLSAPSPFSVMAITAGLCQMDFNGAKFPVANITIYDMNNGNSMDSAGYTAARFPNIKLVKDSLVNPGDGASTGGAVQSYASTLRDAQFLINVFSPRGHDATYGSVTLGFKSHYGTYPPVHTAPSLRDYNCTGPVFNKTVLSVCSGIFGQNIGNGPGGSPQDYTTYAKTLDPTATLAASTIIMSTDPVSAEVESFKVMCLNKGQAYDVNSMPAYLKASAGMTGTLTPVYNIGVIDESKMDIRRIINEKTATIAIGQKSEFHRGTGRSTLTAVSLKGQNNTFIEFSLPQGTVGTDALIHVYDAQGSLVRSISQKVLGLVNHLSWDETNSKGSRVTKGMYFIELVAGANRLSSQVSIV